MKREQRYFLLKVADMQEALTEEELETLKSLAAKVNLRRLERGKLPTEGVIVENDWPMYESVWKMIEESTGKV